MNFKLPDGWASAKIKDLIGSKGLLCDGDWIESKDQDPHGDVRLIQLADIGIGIYKNKSNRFLTKDTALRLNCTFLKNEDILVARLPDPLGRACIFPGDAKESVTAVDVCIIRPMNGAADSRWFKNIFNTPEISLTIGVQATGTTRKRIARKKLEQLQIPVPPLQEQNRIVSKLDSLLASVDSCKARLDKVPEILKRFRQSVLADATSGNLTEDWRKENPNLEHAERLLEKIEVDSDFKPKFKYEKQLSLKANDILRKWAKVQLGRIISVKSGDGLTAKQMAKDGKIPVYGGNGINGYHNEGNVEDETIVIGRVGYYCGSVHLTPKQSWITDNAFITSFSKENISIGFLLILLKATDLRVNDSSTAQPVISGQKIYPIEVLLPPLMEQKEIVLCVEALFSVADQLEAKLVEVQKRVDNLTASIFSKAFKGELVPQDPNDEPAEKLLERIRIEREALASSKNKSGWTKRKKSGRGEKTKSKKVEAGEDSEPATKPNKTEEAIQKGEYTKRTHTKAEKRFDKLDVLKVFRKAIFRQNGIDELTLLKLTGQRMGVKRLSQQIRDELELYINIAIQRKVLYRDENGYSAGAPTIEYYEDDFLIKTLRSVARKGWEYQREHLVDEAASYLGFEKASDAFKDRMKSVFRIALRQKALYRNGQFVGKV
ncbi:MAG: restriction endonuclease subunit S [Deltaproteobacteria bacterium]|nr:restriction endonuclease subunit S [Deltaproteobacteria bacterium]